MKFRKTSLFIVLLFIFGCGAEKKEEIAKDSSLEGEMLPALKGKIVFQSDRDGDWEIFRIEANGKKLVKLTDNEASDEYPVYSPDGKQIAFKSNRTGKWQIYLMEADGKNQRRITQGDFNNYDPAWAPNGRQIAFTSDRNQKERIYLINLDTAEEELLTEVNFRTGLASFSPDGKRILFTGSELGWNVYLMDLEDTKMSRITSRGGNCRPDWSPDGKTIAYVSDVSDSIGDIWLMEADGQEQRRLTTTPELSDYYPAWSPDGKWIVYAASPNGKNGDWDLYIISADGKKRIQLTSCPRNKFPDWSE